MLVGKGGYVMIDESVGDELEVVVTELKDLFLC